MFLIQRVCSRFCLFSFDPCIIAARITLFFLAKLECRVRTASTALDILYYNICESISYKKVYSSLPILSLKWVFHILFMQIPCITSLRPGTLLKLARKKTIRQAIHRKLKKKLGDTMRNKKKSFRLRSTR